MCRQTYTYHITEDHSAKTADVRVLEEVIRVFDWGQVAGDSSLYAILYQRRCMHSEHEILDGLWGNGKIASLYHTLLEVTAPSMNSCILWLLRMNDFFPPFLYVCLHSRQFLTATQHTTNKTTSERQF